MPRKTGRSRGKLKSRSRSRSKGRSRSRSKGRSRSRSRSRSRRSNRRGRASKTSLSHGSKSLENATADSPIRLLMIGEALQIGRHVSELEIVLYRPVPEDGGVPLFFDTTACLFSEYGSQTDYVGVGRMMTNNKGVLRRLHHVVKVETTSKASKNLLQPADGSRVVAGDGVFVNLKKISMWNGLSLCATLFTVGVQLSEVTDVYYAVKKPGAAVPLVIVPVSVSNLNHNSCIALMIRRIRANTGGAWELVRIGETVAQQDVKAVLAALRERGLVDPIDYSFDSSRGRNSTDDGYSDETGTHDDCDDDDDDDDDDSDHDEYGNTNDSLGEPSKTFETLLSNVPRVAREARSQYSIGRSTLNSVGEAGDSSNEDEVLEDALRAVVPKYAGPSLIRYEDHTYNLGSRADRLALHYVGHREEYGLNTAELLSTDGSWLPSVFSSSLGPPRRLSDSMSGILRVSAPPEFLLALPPISHNKNGSGGRRRKSKARSRGRSKRRGRRSARGRKGKGRRSRSRSRSRSKVSRSRSRSSGGIKGQS